MVNQNGYDSRSEDWVKVMVCSMSHATSSISIVGRSYSLVNLNYLFHFTVCLFTCLPGLRLLFTKSSTSSLIEYSNQFFKTTGQEIGSFKIGLWLEDHLHLDIFVVDSSSGLKQNPKDLFAQHTSFFPVGWFKILDWCIFVMNVSAVYGDNENNGL